MNRLRYLYSLVFVCLLVPTLGALDFQIPEAVDMVGFGSPLVDQRTTALSGKVLSPNNVYGLIPRSDIMVKSATADLKAPSSGTVIYVQPPSPLKTIFSFPLGGAMAILHPENYVSLISGLDTRRAIDAVDHNQSTAQHGLVVKKGDTLPGLNGSGLYSPNCFGLRLFDEQNDLWINPIFLASWIRDRTPPVIRDARLTKSDGGSGFIDLSEGVAKDKRISCPPGSYRIYIDAFDTIIPGSLLYSAPYRFIAVLDGKTVVDSSFIAAKCTEAGLSFLGGTEPSRTTLAADGSYSVGQIALVKGEHDLQLQVSDYAGNTDVLKVHISVR